MRNIITIVKKEMLGYFNSAIAYIFTALFLALTSFLFFRIYFLVGIVSMQQFFAVIPWIFLIFIPAITMKSWAEERKNGTVEVLFTLPATDTELVIGKFLAGIFLILITLILSLVAPLTVSLTGSLDWGTVFTSYIGTFLLAASIVAIGNFISSLTLNQISAFLITAVIIFVLFIIGTEAVYSVFPSFAAEFIKNLSLLHHFSSIGRGVIDSRDIVFYLSIIFLFQFFNVKSLESRNW